MAVQLEFGNYFLDPVPDLFAIAAVFLVINLVKENDYLNTIADQCLSKAKKRGSTEASVLVMNSVSENINIRNKMNKNVEKIVFLIKFLF